MALGRPVEVKVTPPEGYVAAFKAQGFSDAAARSYARMTRATLENLATPEDPERGETTLEAYVQGLVDR
jgi:hypothetical protein